MEDARNYVEAARQSWRVGQTQRRQSDASPSLSGWPSRPTGSTLSRPDHGSVARSSLRTHCCSFSGDSGKRAARQTALVRVLALAPIDDGRFVKRRTHRPIHAGPPLRSRCWSSRRTCPRTRACEYGRPGARRALRRRGPGQCTRGAIRAWSWRTSNAARQRRRGGLAGTLHDSFPRSGPRVRAGTARRWAGDR